MFTPPTTVTARTHRDATIITVDGTDHVNTVYVLSHYRFISRPTADRRTTVDRERHPDEMKQRISWHVSLDEARDALIVAARQRGITAAVEENAPVTPVIKAAWTDAQGNNWKELVAVEALNLNLFREWAGISN